MTGVRCWMLLSVIIAEALCSDIMDTIPGGMVPADEQGMKGVSVFSEDQVKKEYF